jgi:hypothetical protein
LDWYFGNAWFGVASLTKLPQAVTLWYLGDATLSIRQETIYECDFLRFPVFQANAKILD